VVLTDGRTVSVAHDVGVPATDLDEQRAALRAKFDALATPVLGASGAIRLAGFIAGLDRLADTADLLAASRPADASL
jgi:hypothetical protein